MKTKNPYAREKWIEQKRQGRPKQKWFLSMLKGVVISDIADLEEIAEIINEGSIDGYVSAHWEKVAQ